MRSRVVPSKIGASVVTAQLVGWLVLLRSVAFDRWSTVLVSLLMIVGARAALRDRTWGVVLAGASGAWMVAAVVLGMGPPWMALAGVLGALPFLRSWASFRRFDRGAAALLATLVAGLGGAGAVAWKAVAPWLFWNVPAFLPTMEAGHGLALAGILAAALGLAVKDRRLLREAMASSSTAEESTTRYRLESEEESVRTRVADSAHGEELVTHDEAELDEEAPRAALRRLPRDRM